MKLLKHVVYVALISMGGCSDRSAAMAPGGAGVNDFTAYVPKLPVRVDRAEALSSAEPTRIGPDHSTVAVSSATTFDQALARGRELLAKGDTAGAKTLFESAVKLDARSAEPHMELARLYIASHERGLAMAEANKAVQLAPLSSQAWNTKGRAELHRFSYEDAIGAFSKAIELNPDNVWAWNNLGYTELTLKRYDDAAQHLAEATSRPGATAYMFNNLGTALEHLDRLEEARVAFEAGGKLGSEAALASRKRLEGVKSIALFMASTKPELVDVGGGNELEHREEGSSYDHHEGATDDPGATDDTGDADEASDAAEGASL